jgi:hypothetical protein
MQLVVLEEEAVLPPMHLLLVVVVLRLMLLHSVAVEINIMQLMQMVTCQLHKTVSM